MKLNEVEKLANELMGLHNLSHLSFRFDGGLRRIGSCVSRGGVAHTITFSKHWATRLPEEEVRDIILHEIAHAIAGHKAGHGYEWKRVARRIGAKPEACKVSDVALELAKYHAVCDCPVHKGKTLASFHRLGKSWRRGKVCTASKHPIRIVEVR